MSPRRSSRARTTQPAQTVPRHTNSSTSSISSGRAERSTRSHHKLPSPRRSIPPRSQSLDDLDDPTRPQSQRSKNRHDEVKLDPANVLGDEEDEEIEEEEVTRCICGHQDYPGLPGSSRDAAKAAPKLNADSKSIIVAPEIFPEDAGGLFIQCDMCKVWQHGGCVGILDEAMSPEEYFCEECRKDLHRITTAPNGQKSSLYLPVQDTVSAEASPEPPTRDRNSRRSKEAKALGLSAEAMSGKRRSTMNSRDAAYDEAEQLRRAIEESKKQGGSTSVDTSIRRGKRSRSDSEERKEGIKRQRTTSGSSSSPLNSKHSLSNADSDEELGVNHKMGEGSSKKTKSSGGRNPRDKEALEREREREKQRADAAGRRKGRAERRRADAILNS
ncbi:Zinc finger, RING/FYVE/PHD-type [Lasallia pustulata]|uniref:Zinc finger, RING/FYVE/PHD-type n=1 Tax=Lasallia pustulata TaxID=136370 RepID=A0A1W5CVR2_9LECA|nr:Zinc finger, RING/FYVE/PHD-type [Lasallia pustulata]